MTPASATVSRPGYSSYLLPLFAAVSLHALLFWFIAGGMDGFKLHSKPEQNVRKVIQASLVSIKQKKVKAKVVPKKVAKPPAKNQQKKKTATQVKKETPVEKPKVEPKVEPKAEKEAAKNKEQLLDDLFADEDQALAEEEELSQVALYVQLMKQTIEQSWSRPPSARNNMQAVLAIQLVPNGDVVSVSIRQGSGNSAFDRAAVLAVERVGRFDFLNEMPNALFEKHFRKIALTFKPEDLRL